MQLTRRGTPRSKLLMKLSGSLRLGSNYHEGQIELFVKSGDQVGFGGIEYDCPMLALGCGQLTHQLSIDRHISE